MVYSTYVDEALHSTLASPAVGSVAKNKRRWDSGMSNAGAGVLVMVADVTAAPRCRAGTEGGREKKEDLIFVCAHCGVEQSFVLRSLVLEVFLQLRLL